MVKITLHLQFPRAWVQKPHHPPRTRVQTKLLSLSHQSKNMDRDIGFALVGDTRQVVSGRLEAEIEVFLDPLQTETDNWNEYFLYNK